VFKKGSHHSSQGSAALQEFGKVVAKLTDKEMKKEQVRMCEAFVVMLTFSLLVSQPRVKSRLACFTLTQVAS
jgi:hypothetical protein